MSIIARPGFVINDGAEISFADFAKLIKARTDDHGLFFGTKTKASDKLTSVGGYLDVVGYAHPLPALTSVGGYLDVVGYAHPLPNTIVYAGVDSRGYAFAGQKTAGGWRIRAGRRDFAPTDALKHWGPGGCSDRPDCLALVNQIIAEAERRDTQEAHKP